MRRTRRAIWRTGIGLIIAFSLALSSAAGAQQRQTEREAAVERFLRRNYAEALPLLRRVVAANPGDEDAWFGLVVALLITADATENRAGRAAMIVEARSALQKNNLQGMTRGWDAQTLKKLLSDDEALRSAAARSLGRNWPDQPPLVFDSPPPRGIELPPGYRHKGAWNFEGQAYGVISNPDRLTIEYGFGFLYQSDDVEAIPGDQWESYEEITQGEHFFRCLLTRDKKLTISVLVGAKRHPAATFWAAVSNFADVREVISIVTRLKATSSIRLLEE